MAESAKKPLTPTWTFYRPQGLFLIGNFFLGFPLPITKLRHLA